MAKLLWARPPQEELEERRVRKLAASRHGPADWILHARMVTKSWEGHQVNDIAQELHCSEQTVRRRLHRFNIHGFGGLGDRKRPGRPRRLTMEDDRRILALVRQPPSGKPERCSDESLDVRDEQGSAQWSLNALEQAAQDAGITVKRSQIRRIYLREGVRWR